MKLQLIWGKFVILPCITSSLFSQYTLNCQVMKFQFHHHVNVLQSQQDVEVLAKVRELLAYTGKETTIDAL